VERVHAFVEYPTLTANGDIKLIFFNVTDKILNSKIFSLKGGQMKPQWLNYFMFIFMICLLSACTMQVVSKYDEQTDTNVTALQKKFDTYFLRLKNEKYPECSYTNNKAFYDDAKIQLSGIDVRAKAIPNNTITVQELDALSQSLSSLEKNHILRDANQSCLPASIIDSDQTMFNSIFTAILKLEIAKKRGEAK
jgi:hypothetical protein